MITGDRQLLGNDSFRSAGNAEKRSADGYVYFSTPRVLHLSRSSTLQQRNIVTGIIWLLTGSAEHIREMELKLEAGEHKPRPFIAALRKYTGWRSHRRHSLDGRTELMYEGHVLISADFSQRSVNWITFPGGDLCDHQFMVRERLSDPNIPRRQYLVIIQQPKYSMLELWVNALVPGEMELSEKHQSNITEQYASIPLLPMKGGWVAGGRLVSHVFRLAKQRDVGKNNISKKLWLG